MYRSSGSIMRNIAKGSASLWLRRNPIEYVTTDAGKVEKLDALPKKVEKVVKATEKLGDNAKPESNKLELLNDASEIASENNTIMIKQEQNNKLTEKDEEIKLLKEKFKLMEEKNARLEISLKKEKEKNRDLQQQIEFDLTTTDKVKILQDSLSGKTNEVNHLKEKFDLQKKEHQACKKELNATKNQLHYKHLALDGIIKSNIKLQEQLLVVGNGQNVVEKIVCPTTVCLQTDAVDISSSKDSSGGKPNVAVVVAADRKNSANKNQNKRRRRKKRFD